MFLDVEVKYPKELHEKHNELPFLAERMKIRKEGILVPNSLDKRTYVVYIKNLNQGIKHGLKLKKRCIQLLDFNKVVE